MVFSFLWTDCVKLPSPENSCKLYKTEYVCFLLYKNGFKSCIFRVQPTGSFAPAQSPCGRTGSRLSCISSCIFPKMCAKPGQNSHFETIRTIEGFCAACLKYGQSPRKNGDEPACSDQRRYQPANGPQHSKCGRSAQNRRESSNLSISAMRSASEKLVDLFPFYGETADRFCSMGATMSCSMAAADCFFVAYCRCP